MVEPRFLEVLRKILTGLEGTNVDWAVVGSLGLALRGAPLEPHDIDIMTDGEGAYEIERIFSEFVTKKVALRTSEQIQSHFGALEIDGIKIEIMGGFQHRRLDKGWDEPLDIKALRRTVTVEGMRIPVLSLESTCSSYSRLGRSDKVRIIKEMMSKTSADD